VWRVEQKQRRCSCHVLVKRVGRGGWLEAGALQVLFSVEVLCLS
jgi:hypothetical protein